MTVPLLGGVLPQLLPLVVPDSQLIISALAGFAVIIILITWLKMNPFLALTIGALGVGVAGGLEPTHAVESFAKGFGATMGSVGVLIGLGAMFGKLLTDSGGADGIVDTLVDRSSPRMLPWTMALVGAVIGLPMFFEIGLVLLMPVIILVARRSGLPLMKIAIPTDYPPYGFVGSGPLRLQHLAGVVEAEPRAARVEHAGVAVAKVAEEV